MNSPSLILICLSLTCYAQPPVPNVYLDLNYDKTNHFDGITPNQLQNLKGNIHVLTQYSHEVEFKPDGSFRKGELIIGTPTYTFVFAPDKKIKEEWTYEKKEGVPAFKAYYHDFKNGKRDSTLFIRNGKVFPKSHCTYDQSDFLIQEYENEEGGKAMEKQILSTDQRGDTLIQKRKEYSQCFLHHQLIKTVQNNDRIYLYEYSPAGALRQKEIYASERQELIEKFDEQGNLIYEYVMRYKDSTLDYTNERTRKYDTKGNCLEQKEVYVEKEYTRKTHDLYHYLNDRLVSITRGEDNMAELTYTKEGDFIKRKYYYADEKFTYKYDTKGNWVERIMYIAGKPYNINVRKITYY